MKVLVTGVDGGRILTGKLRLPGNRIEGSVNTLKPEGEKRKLY